MEHSTIQVVMKMCVSYLQGMFLCDVCVYQLCMTNSTHSSLRHEVIAWTFCFPGLHFFTAYNPKHKDGTVENPRSCTLHASTNSLSDSGTHCLLPSQAKQGQEGFRRQSSEQSESEAMPYSGGIEGDKEAAYQYSSDTSLPVQDGGLQWSIGGVPLHQQLR